MTRRQTFALGACAVGLVCCGPRVPSAPAAFVAAAPAPAVGTKAPRDHGLVATVIDGKRTVVTTVPTPNFTLDAAEALHPGVDPAFSATWTADLVVAAGTYQFFTSPKAGAPGNPEMKIDGRVVGSEKLALEEGKHAFSLSYRRVPGPARLQVEWSSDLFGREPIPGAAFRPTGWTAQGQHWQQIDSGRALYDELGCRGCHQRASDDPHVENFYLITRRGRGPGLSRMGRRLTAGWVYSWLGKPRQHRNNTKMPTVLHSPAERADVTAFLMSLREPGATTSGDTGPWVEPPLSPDDQQKAQKLFGSIGCSACHGESDGKFSLRSVGSKFQPFALVEYMMRPDNFDHSGRMPSMLRGGEGTLLARWLLENRNAEFERSPPQGNPNEGRKLVETRGCLGCHSIDLQGQPVYTALVAPRFEALPAQPRGCVSDTIEKRYARYDFGEADRAAILAYLQVKEVAPAPLWELARTLDSRGCRNCHETDVPATNALAEIPPSLRDAGHKLRPQWIERQLSAMGGQRTRPWYTLRMPRFHRAGNLGVLLAAGAGEPTTLPKVAAAAEATSRVVQEGVQYLGRAEGGMSCVTCHSYAAFDPKSATPAPDLSTAAQRLRPAWFTRWLRDPGRIAPGTQMPAFFVDVDEDFATSRINALWTALTLGKNMPLPEGVDLSNFQVPYPLADKPVVVRTFLEGSGPRSLAVGWQGAAYAFDAETCNLVYTWTGGFLDMRPVWVGRGGDFAVPLGPIGYRARQQSTISLVADPQAKPQFEGYSIAANVPQLEYQLGALMIEDQLLPTAAGWKRTLRFRGGKNATDIKLTLDNEVQVVAPKANLLQWRVPANGKLVLELAIRPTKTTVAR